MGSCGTWEKKLVLAGWLSRCPPCTAGITLQSPRIEQNDPMTALQRLSQPYTLLLRTHAAGANVEI